MVHPGGPYFKNKDQWTIPKGMADPGESLLEAAIREFKEETGITPEPPFHELGNIRQKGGKQVFAWGFRGNWEFPQGIVSNTFQMEWPPKSGQIQEFPEVDQASWFSTAIAETKIIPAQIPLIKRVLDLNL